jgi:hypothetical protein
MVEIIMKYFHNMNAETKVALLVPAQELEDDDRYDWFAAAISGNQMTIKEIANAASISLDTAITSAKILYIEGYLEILE